MDWLPKWCLIFLFDLFFLTAKTQKVFFEQLTLADGLPSDYVNQVLEDAKGNLWIATDKGVCRYDGYQFLYFNKDNGLTDNFVICLEEAANGDILIGSFGGGLCRFNGDSIMRIPLPSAKEFSAIGQVLSNQDSSFFLISGNATLHYFSNEGSSPVQILDSTTKISRIDRDNFLVQTVNAIYHMRKSGDKIDLNSVYVRQQGGRFIFSGVHKNKFIYLEADQLFMYELQGKDLVLLLKVPMQSPLPTGYLAYFFASGNKIWIGSKSLFHMDNYKNAKNLGNENGLGGALIRNICQDKQENIYICTYGGGIYLWSGNYLEEYNLKGKVNSIFKQDTVAYLTSTKGIYKYSSAGKLTEFVNSASEGFTSILKGRKGNIYLGTYGGFIVVDNEKTLQQLNFSKKRRKEMHLPVSVSGFKEGKNGQFLVATFGRGIYVYDQKFQVVDHYTNNPGTLVSEMIEFLIPVGERSAALTFSSGISIIDSSGVKENISKNEGLLSNTVYSVYSVNEKQTWIGTLNGINLLQDGRIKKTYSHAEGLIGNKVVCIFQDSQERLWALSDQYLHLVEKNRLRAIRSHPILFDRKQSINRAAYQEKTGKLFIGLTDQLLIVNISQVAPNTITRLPELSSFYADSLLVSFEFPEAKIPPKVSTLKFRFKNHDYSAQKKHDLYFKLKGFNDEWKLLENTSELVFEKLSSGEYELWSKTINPDGYASPEIMLQRIKILPAFWKRPWFLAITSVLIIGCFSFLAYLISRTRYRHKLNKLQKEFELQVERERIARELHDNVGSQLTYLINKIDDEPHQLTETKNIGELGDFARSAMQELRETIWALDKKKIDAAELQNKIRHLIRLYKNNLHQVELQWEVADQDMKTLKSIEALNVYRIIQEALNNAKKYSEASMITVKVQHDQKRLNIQVFDNGKGFDMNACEKGYGLRNMRKRAEEINGDLAIDTAPGKGTMICLKMDK